MSDPKNYYKILELSPSASSDDIRKAYKKLAIKWHPDKNPHDPERATEMFKKVAEAYEVLGKESSRQEYDTGGGRIRSSAGQQDFGEYEFDREFSVHRAHDLFREFFAAFEDMHGQRNSGGGRRNGSRDGGGRRGFGFGFDMFDNHFDSFPGMSHSRMGSDLFGRTGRDPFDDPFFTSGFGGGGGFSGVSTSFSSSSSSFGMGGMGSGRSVSTSTTIGPDGRQVTRRETTILHSDGRRETSVEEFINGQPVIDSAIEDDHGRSSRGQRSVISTSSRRR